MRRLAPEIISGSLITHSISIRCAYCDALFLDPRGSETIENADASFRAMPPTLVCLSCYKRFVKPVPLGWSQHPLAHMLSTPTRQRPTPGNGQTRPSHNAAQRLSAGQEMIRKLAEAQDTVQAARAAIRRL
jgi:hypothetical protein